MMARAISGAVMVMFTLSATSLGVAQSRNRTTAAARLAGRPNILFLMADDWSSPHARALGDPVVKTPTFDRVAREGVLFQNAFASSPSCTPSRLAVATGQWHWRLQDGANLGGSLSEGVPVYPELLQAAGYQIGFARKGAEPSGHKFTHRDPFGPRFKTFDEFIARRKAGEPFCFWYGAGEPHRPYRFGEGEQAGLSPAKVKLPDCLPDNETTRRDFADYLHRIERYDADCARILSLLEKSGELENTIVVMSGDNGMPFPRCKATLYDTGTHVPLAIRWGRTIKRGRTVTDFVSLTDLAPTFLEAAGLTPPEQMTGHSLLALLHSNRSGQVEASRTYVLTGMERHVFAQPARAIRTAEFLYIRNFDLKNWPRIETSEPYPRIDYDKGEWLAAARAFPLNIEPSPTLEYLLDHRDARAITPFFTRATGPRPQEELYDLKTDPSQLHNVASERKYARKLADLRERLTAGLRASGDPRMATTKTRFETRKLAGWTVHINSSLLADDPRLTARALELLRMQLDEIVRVVPAAAVAKLQQVPLWISPEYRNTPPRAEYHPNPEWLREHGRDPAMARGIEFTNVRIFEAETRRMPNFALHELAHAYHDRELRDGFANGEIKTAYEKARTSGKYDRVERRDSDGRKSMDRAYAMTNPQEYFAECTEAFFARNDFYPYARDQLKQHDPEMFDLLIKLWGARAQPGASKRKAAVPT